MMACSSRAVEIELLSETLKDRKRFVQFQFDLYRKDPMWVAPLISDELKSLDQKKNPGLLDCQLQLWLAMRNGQCVGRIAGVINAKENRLRQTRAARFCLLEFIDDHEVAKALLRTVETWAMNHGMNLLEGPLGLTTFERSAILVEGFNHLPTVVSSYNPPYYLKHLLSCHYLKHVDYLEHHFRLPRELKPKYRRIAQYVLAKKHLKMVENLSRRQLRPLGNEIFQLINDAYRGLFEFTPMNDAEIEVLISKFMSLIDRRFVKIVFDSNQKIVGVAIAIPSYSKFSQNLKGKKRRLPYALAMSFLRGKEETLDLYLIAVHHDHRNSGLHAAMMQAMHQSALEAGIKWVETNGELETNSQILSIWKDIDHETHKRRRLFSKRLESAQ